MIEAVSEDNLNELLPLIRSYQEFYNAKNISDSNNREFFKQFGLCNPFGCQFLYRQNGHAVGFATIYFTYVSTIISKVAILNDLYTIPQARGQGIGRSLVEYCGNFAKNNGAARLQWITAPDNHRAQDLYNSLNTTYRSWILYTYDVHREDYSGS